MYVEGRKSGDGVFQLSTMDKDCTELAKKIAYKR
jgi:hypothetical protein